MKPKEYSATAVHPDSVATEETEDASNSNSSATNTVSLLGNDKNSPDPSAQSASCPDNSSLSTVGGEPESTDL
ncbi:hypothetical protein TNCV_3436581 [Trichonephila clavipes]|nr:hypothetical protein TNCV_3436581 [Trichonephila clavipes]